LESKIEYIASVKGFRNVESIVIKKLADYLLKTISECHQ